MIKHRTQKWYQNIPQVLTHFIKEELLHHTLIQTLNKSLQTRKLQFSHNVTMSSLLERQAQIYPCKPFIYFGKSVLTFKYADTKTNQMAHYLQKCGVKPGLGLGIMMDNCPEYLFTYFASQRLGAYAVPINSSLVGEGLEYLINHSNIKALFIDEKYLTALKPIIKRLKHLKTVHVKSEGKDKVFKKPFCNVDDYLKEKQIRSEAWRALDTDISTIMYTSGTTGKPKGVVYYYHNDWLRKAGLLNHLIYNSHDVLYTCLPLFHANALFLTFSASLWLGIPVVLSKRFSASRFWEEVNQYQATSFNVIGVMVPILLKNPMSHSDVKNAVRLVLSAACPADCWSQFENRFGLKIWEGYSAVDGGQNFIFNMGNAPVGSIGKFNANSHRIINDEGDSAGANEPGELAFRVRKDKRVLEYFKDETATKKKIKGEYLHTGDIVYRDKKNFLYFVGRKTESMRRRGENVSAYEVENVILKNENVLECAAFGVPSDLGEEDIMCCIALAKNKKFNPHQLVEWLDGKLAAYAIPRYFRIVDTIPKTSTHRVIKHGLIQEGITQDTIDLEASNNKRRSG